MRRIAAHRVEMGASTVSIRRGDSSRFSFISTPCFPASYATFSAADYPFRRNISNSGHVFALRTDDSRQDS